MEYRRLTLLIVLYLARGTGISRGLNAFLIERVENTDSSDVFVITVRVVCFCFSFASSAKAFDWTETEK